MDNANNESWAHIELYHEEGVEKVRPLSTGRSSRAAQLPPPAG